LFIIVWLGLIQVSMVNAPRSRRASCAMVAVVEPSNAAARPTLPSAGNVTFVTVMSRPGSALFAVFSNS
jgi:hypothetical protein